MKMIIVNEFGGPEKLILHDVSMPSAGEGQIAIKVEASGVNFSDGTQKPNQYGLHLITKVKTNKF